MKLLVPFLALILSGCSLMAPYDPATDNGVTQLEKDTDSLVSNTVVHNLPYKPDYYTNLRIELKLLEIRAASLPNNTLTSEQLVLLGKQIDYLEALHINNMLTLADVKVVQDALDRNFTSILTLELAKKR